jgi:hypothetical protein
MDYNDVLKDIEKVESNETADKEIIVDLRGVFSHTVNTRVYGKTDSEFLIDNLDEIAHGKNIKQQSAGNATASDRMQQVNRRAADHGNVKHSFLGREKALISAGEGAIGGGLAKLKEREPRIDESQLILKTLPLNEQISDLSKIAEGLSAGNFDNEHIAIISAEVKGLKNSVKKSKRYDDLEKGLADERNRKMNEVIKLLGGKI